MKGAIWSYSNRKGENKMSEIIKHYKGIGVEISGSSKTRLRYEIYFENGDVWKLIRPREGARGYKFDVSFIDKDITDNFMLNAVIIPTTKRSSRTFNSIRYF